MSVEFMKNETSGINQYLYNFHDSRSDLKQLSLL